MQAGLPHLQEGGAPVEDSLVPPAAALELRHLQHACRVAAGGVRVDGQHGGGAHGAGLGRLQPQVNADIALVQVV